MAIATTKMSSRGQVVIPEEVRKRLHLKEGARFAVIDHGDTVMLKIISPPSPETFKEMLAVIRTSFKKAGIKKSDVAKAIKSARAGKRSK